MRARSRRSRRKKARNKTGFLIAAVGLIAVAMVAGAATFVMSVAEKDPETGCEAGQISPTTAILVDRTGKLSGNHLHKLEMVLDYELKQMPANSRLQVYTIDDVDMGGASEPLLDLCKPSSKEELNQLYQNVHQASRQIENFNSQVTQAVDQVVAGNDAKASPIVESLFDISFVSEMNADLKLQRIVLASDLLQHSDLHSFYGGNPASTKLKPEVLNSLPNLMGIDVQIYLLQRDGREGQLQSIETLAWWEQALNYSSASTIKISKVRQ